MVYRTRINYTAEQRAEIWDRPKAGLQYKRKLLPKEPHMINSSRAYTRSVKYMRAPDLSLEFADPS
jgi:hypothetical protein